MSSCQYTVIPSSPGQNTVEYPMLTSLQTESSEFMNISGKMLRPRAALLSFLFGSNAFPFVSTNDPFGMLSCLSDGLYVGMCSSCIF